MAEVGDNDSVREQAIQYLADGHAAETLTPGAIRRLAGQLQNEAHVGWARSVLLKRFQAGVPPGCLRRYRQLIARAIYKDPELRRLDALYKALDFLDDPGAVAGAPESSSFVEREQHALVGAIYKRIWDLTHDGGDLDRSLEGYERAAGVVVTSADLAEPRLGCGDCSQLCWIGDEGPHYPLINKAFVMDRLAGRSASDDELNEVDAVRAEVLTALNEAGSLDDSSWTVVSAIEASVGAGNAEQALALVDRLEAKGEIANWQMETTAAQLAAILKFRIDRYGPNILADAEITIMRRLLAWPSTVAADEVVRYIASSGDRMGLALSGGGFRASLFHLGVLAALAEFDVLRDIETISCVSGGSIAGAAYYLQLKQLLETKPSEQIEVGDYVDVVKQTIGSFNAVVTKKNLRNRAFFHPASLVRVFRGENVSDRIAALYDRLLYHDPNSDGGPVLLCETKVNPEGERHGFNPKQHNWRRAAKVPSLLLNATSTNTGYVWQFTSTWMGETPSAVIDSIDAVDLVERIYLDETNPHHRITLGQAVAASAAVPGLFPPIPLKHVVRNRVLRFVDGGVADNQGMVGLRDQDCTSIIVSDASGQHQANDKPSRLRASSLLRSGSLGRAALRRANLTVLQADSGWPINHWFVHLTKGLTPGVRGATTSQPVQFATVTANGLRLQSSHDGFRGAPDELATQAGLPRRVQAKLAALRTDLDRFSSDEANALMYSGYLQMIAALTEQSTSAGSDRVVDNSWPFLSIAKRLASPGLSNDVYQRLVVDLDRGQHLFFRRARRIWPRPAKRFEVG